MKTNRERFTRMLQGQDDLVPVSTMILSELATLVSAQHGVFYSMTDAEDGGESTLQLQAGYGYEERKQLSTSFKLGEGLVGQCAKEKKRILLTEVPADYVRINSGLGAATPLNIIVLPILFEGSLRAVIELASFSPFTPTQQTFLDSITESIGIVLSTIQAATLTESLLKQSQSLAEELRAQQQELRESNADLERQATLLAEQNIEATQRNQEIEQSKREIEDKAGQLTVSSKYKSEFIANMSHELRTPLNSLLILAEQLEDNPEKTMTAQQVEYASVIHSSGKELLELLNSILDLAKVESGTVTVELSTVSVDELRTTLLREFEPVARGKGLGFTIETAPGSPSTIVTDPQRLRQILKNLLANAFKFTETGTVGLHIGPAHSGWSREVESLGRASSVVSFSVTDTGIGISDEQQHRIFEAFAQGDGTTARLYGGTGLGLSISRELVGLLGGEVNVASSLGHGSTFTVYLPASGPVAADRQFHAAGGRLPCAPRTRSQHSTGRLLRLCRRSRNRRQACCAPAGEGAARQPPRGREDSRRRRRRPEHLRHDGAARARPRGRDGGRERRRSTRRARACARHRHRPDGHHDAGDGRLRDHAGHPGDRAVQGSADRRCHREGDGRRATAMPRRRRQRLRPEAGRLRRASRRPPPVASRQSREAGSRSPRPSRRSSAVPDEPIRRKRWIDRSKESRSSSSTTTSATSSQ